MISAPFGGKIKNSRVQHSIVLDPGFSLVDDSLSGRTKCSDPVQPIRTQCKSGSGVRRLLRTDSDLGGTSPDSPFRHSQINPPLSPTNTLPPPTSLFSFSSTPTTSSPTNLFSSLSSKMARTKQTAREFYPCIHFISSQPAVTSLAVAGAFCVIM